MLEAQPARDLGPECVDSILPAPGLTIGNAEGLRMRHRGVGHDRKPRRPELVPDTRPDFRQGSSSRHPRAAGHLEQDGPGWVAGHIHLPLRSNRLGPSPVSWHVGEDPPDHKATVQCSLTTSEHHPFTPFRAWAHHQEDLSRPERSAPVRRGRSAVVRRHQRRRGYGVLPQQRPRPAGRMPH